MRMATAKGRMSTEGARLRNPLAAILVAAVLAACGHDAHAPSGSGLPARAITHHGDATELFVEFTALAAGERTALAVHLTRLDDYSPVAAGVVDVVLSGAGAPEERFRVEAPRSPGLFRPTIQPRAAGERQLRIRLVSEALEVEHDLGAVVVHASREDAARSRTPPSPEGEITLYKEQQWSSDFGIEVLHETPLRTSVTAPARVRASADGEFIVSAATPGQVRASGRFPQLGDTVEAGDVLATLMARSGTLEDGASLQAEREAARAAVSLAEAELSRAERLLALEAVAARRVEVARAEAQTARARLRAAEQRVTQLGDSSAGGIALRAPIAGTLAQVHVGNGAAVQAGDALFHIVDRRELWLEVLVSESDAASVQAPVGAELELPGAAGPVTLEVGNNARVVGVGEVIDPVSRSLPVILALQAPDPRLRVNQRLQARLFTGQVREALSVPTTAVIDDGGERVVYVMLGGESFTRRPVRLGDRDGDRIEVRDGLAAGEVVVARGAMLVRLAAATPEAMGHGHAH